MGLIHSRAAEKRKKAEAKLLGEQRKQVKADAAADKQDALAAKWEPIIAAMEAGERSYDDLSLADKMSVPLRYSRRVMAVRKAAKNGTPLPGAAAPEADITTRLHALAALHEQGLVTDEEFAARRTALLDEATS